MTGAQLADARRALGKTQAELAFELDVHPQTVSKWERGQHRVPAAVAKLVQVSQPATATR